VLRPTHVASAQGAILTVLEDGSVLASGVNTPREAYTLTLRTGLAKITALRLEALAHASLPENGPGRGPLGTFGILDLAIKVAPADQPALADAVKIDRYGVSPVDAADDLGLALDDNAATRWSVRRPRGQMVTATLAFDPPIAHQTGSVITLNMANGYNLGRFRVLATATEDEAKLAVTPAEPKSQTTVPGLRAGPYARYVNVGGTEPIDALGKTWVPIEPVSPLRDFGYKGGRRGEYNDQADPILKSEIAGIDELIFKVPNGRYKVTLYFMENREKNVNRRVFHVALEGKEVLVSVDLAKEPGHRKPAVKTTTIHAKDGELNIQFVKAVERGLEPIINAVSVEQVRR